MSDVYTTATFAECIRDDGSLERVLVNANFECDLSEGKAKIDATDELLELHKAYCAAMIKREKQALEAKFARAVGVSRQRLWVLERGGCGEAYDRAVAKAQRLV